MKKIFTLGLVLAAFIFTGCGANGAKVSSDSSSVKVQTVAEYDVVTSGKYPTEYREYNKESAEVKAYHSDDESELAKFKDEYLALTGSEYKGSFDGTMVIARAGVKNNSSYSIKAANIVDSGRYTNIELVIVKTTKILVSQTLTQPYIVIYIPNHKEVKYTIKNQII